ncbi:phosphatidate cytidylyltransferase [Ancylobacter pratisalsi]|uniref:Phosphatidate cytidylyltransferase n=1 Tax=Ancylobacter pratisalsi TaxID=1745854 RepID=A0A6P1YQF0_9HYPH|nr:phosphatidate cytidylyltransferase [Ancylobacter pratisalsi]QIB35677.1 phosphatidate cytidylyltransferase [Ancylobacter pratisalsi]
MSVRLGADFLPRLMSALVLGPVVIVAAILGEWPFEILVGVAAILVLWEWVSMVGVRPKWALVGAGGLGLVAALLILHVRPPATALAIVMVTMIACALMGRGHRQQRLWSPFGVLYAAAMALPVEILRDDATLGLASLVWLLAVVWSTDIAAYFCGRLLGGPKLWPRVSPNKTWSGAIGGTAFGTCAGMLVVFLFGIDSALLAAPVACIASIASQGGDLFESSMKRRFGVKDSSALIPGHGGLMDRLDGLIAAAALALLIGMLRNPAAPAQGLLLW